MVEKNHSNRYNVTVSLDTTKDPCTVISLPDPLQYKILTHLLFGVDVDMNSILLPIKATVNDKDCIMEYAPVEIIRNLYDGPIDHKGCDGIYCISLNTEVSGFEDYIQSQDNTLDIVVVPQYTWMDEYLAVLRLWVDIRFGDPMIKYLALQY